MMTEEKISIDGKYIIYDYWKKTGQDFGDVALAFKKHALKAVHVADIIKFVGDDLKGNSVKRISRQQRHRDPNEYSVEKFEELIFHHFKYTFQVGNRAVELLQYNISEIRSAHNNGERPWNVCYRILRGVDAF